MDEVTSQSLLADHDPPPVQIINPGGASSFLLIGDHAGNRIPPRLGSLGLPDDELARHIGWDIGIAGLGEHLAGSLDATFIRQTYSRLAIDCNRDPAAADSIPEISDGTTVPANVGLSPGQRIARIAAIHRPYQSAIAAELKRRDQGGIGTILVSLHSFTPSFGGVDRPWQIGVLHDKGDPAFALRFLHALQHAGDIVVGDNAPYRMDSIDYTVPRHAYPARRPYVEIEIRQDLIGDPEGQMRWSAIVEAALTAACTHSQ
ncbi:MAG: hypothetical protein JWO25_856 [Alphaproteobacteria bacterium]|nr:hypothetical protein [Alphaproteobacteria bacterium]